MKKAFLLLTTLAVFTACDKDDDPQDDPGNYQPPLPTATTTGANIFACYVDGKAYIANKNTMTAYTNIIKVGMVSQLMVNGQILIILAQSVLSLIQLRKFKKE